MSWKKTIPRLFLQLKVQQESRKNLLSNQKVWNLFLKNIVSGGTLFSIFILFLNNFFRLACGICITNRIVDQRVYRYKRDVIDHFIAKHAIGLIESIDKDMMEIYVDNDNTMYYDSGKNKKYYF